MSLISGEALAVDTSTTPDGQRREGVCSVKPRSGGST